MNKYEADQYPSALLPDTGIDFLDHIVDVVSLPSRPHLVGVLSVLLIENLDAGDPLHQRLRLSGRALTVHAAFAQEIDVGN